MIFMTTRTLFYEYNRIVSGNIRIMYTRVTGELLNQPTPTQNSCTIYYIVYDVLCNKL